MSQPLKILGGAAALITAALVGGTLIGSVLAAPAGSGNNPSDAGLAGDETTGATGEYCQVFLDTFAKELGVSADELAPAAKTAAIAAINAAVAGGDLTQDVADQMIEKINAADGSGCGLIGWRLHHFGGHGPRVELMSGMFEAAASTLNMDVSELRTALADSTLEEVATAQGVDYADVVAAALASAKTDLDAAVQAGTITQDKADAIYDRLETWLNEGSLGNWGARDGHPFGGHRFFGPFGPPADAPADSSDSSSGTDAAQGTSA